MNRSLKRSAAFLTMVSLGFANIQSAHAATVTRSTNAASAAPTPEQIAQIKQKLTQSYNYMLSTSDEKWEADIDTAVDYLNQRGESEKVTALLSLKDKAVKEAALKGMKEKIDDESTNGIASILFALISDDMSVGAGFFLVILLIPLLIVTLSGETAESY